MNKTRTPSLFFLTLLICGFAFSGAGATGLYLNLPSWFAAADTSRASIIAGQSSLQREYEDASLFTFETVFEIDARLKVKTGILYPVIRRPDGFIHGLADGSVSAIYRVMGDSLNVSGLFLRGDLRIPTGTMALRPFSAASLDGGGGVEFRESIPLLRLAGSATYTLTGAREKEGTFRQRNYLLLALMVGLELGRGTSLQLSAFSFNFRGGDYRESYFLALSRSFSGRVDISVSGGVDSGSDSERIFNSIFSFSILYRFPHALQKQPQVDAPPPADGVQGGSGGAGMNHM